MLLDCMRICGNVWIDGAEDICGEINADVTAAVADVGIAVAAKVGCNCVWGGFVCVCVGGELVVVVDPAALTV